MTGPSRFGLYLIKLAALCLVPVLTHATDIHKCTDENGVTEYSQLPCADARPTDTDSNDVDQSSSANDPTRPDGDARDRVEEADTVYSLAAVDPPADAATVEACKKHFRDAIDEIDAEIGREYEPAKADEYKRRLLTLTRGLRNC